MKRLLIIVSLVAVGMLNLTAQETQIDLSKYKLPDMKRQTLEFGFDLRNAFDKNFFGYAGGDQSKINSIGSTLDLNYSFYRNSVKWQQEIYASLILSGGNQEEREDGNITFKNSSMGSYFSLNSINRYYFNNLFLGFYPELNSSYYSSTFNWITNNSRSYDSRFESFIPIHVGIGRIERVEDARQAVYIYNALKKVGKANEGKSEEDLLQLAEKVSQLKNERFFDARKKKIYELEELDKYLKENGFVDEDDITYFATLEDMWEYGNSPNRRSGFRVSSFANPGYSIYEGISRGDYNNRATQKYYMFKTGLALKYEKPISTYWQSSLNVESYYGITRNRTTYRYSNRFDWRTPGVHIGITERIGFYPNTRTSFNAVAGVYAVKHFDGTKNDDGDFEEYIGSFKGKSLYMFAGISGNYYFSPKLRFSGYLNFNYRTDVTRGDYENVDYYEADYTGWNINGGTPYEKNSFDYKLSLKFEYFLF